MSGVFNLCGCHTLEASHKGLGTISILGHNVQSLFVLHRSFWLQYDEEFRMQVAFKRALSWDQVHLALWLQNMMGTRAMLGKRAHSEHMVHCNSPAVRGSSVASGSCQGAGQSVQPGCFAGDFNFQVVCSRKSCSFWHENSLCGGSHAVSGCPGVSSKSCSISKGTRALVGQDLKLEKRHSPLKLKVLNGWLCRFPNLCAAEYLRLRFQ